MPTLSIAAKSSLRQKAPHLLANTTFVLAGIGLVTVVGQALKIIEVASAFQV